jgi:hypothetical protein
MARGSSVKNAQKDDGKKLEIIKNDMAEQDTPKYTYSGHQKSI